MDIPISRLLGTALAAGVAVACVDRPYDGPMRGTWDLTMTLQSGLPGRSARPGATVSGRVTVPDPTPIEPRAFPEATPADVRLDLGALGLGVSPRSQPTLRERPGRTVRLDLGSTPNELVLEGKLDGDSVVGVWHDEFRAGGAVGRFVMRRAR